MDDRPAGLSKFADEKFPQSERISDKPVRSVTPASIARSSPGIAVFGQVEIKWRSTHGTLRGPLAFIAMREHDQAAVPVRRHTDCIIGASMRSLAQDALVGPTGPLQPNQKSEGKEGSNGNSAVANYPNPAGCDNHAHRASSSRSEAGPVKS